LGWWETGSYWLKATKFQWDKKKEFSDLFLIFVVIVSNSELYTWNI
jgi:hypothetical protein